VFIHVAPHPHFERDGTDLYCAIPISMTQASLGAEILVPTLEDKTVRVSVPAGTQHGRVLRLRGEGVPELHNPGRRGDLYIRIMVRVPVKVPARGKELLRELAQVIGEEHSPSPIPLSELKQ